MTEEGPSGHYRMTMQRDRRGRWMPTKGERTMNIQKAREERRSFYVGESKEHGTFSIASAEASLLHREFYLSRRNADEVSWNHLSAEERTQFSKAIEWQGVLDFKAVGHRFHASGCDQKKTTRPSDLLSTCPTLEGDRHWSQGQGQMVQDPDIHEIERSCPTPELSSINITLQILASTTFEGTLADGEKELCKATRVFEMNRCTPLRHPKGQVTGESTDSSGPRGLRACQWRARVAITNRLPVERGRPRDECVWTLPFH